MQDPISYKAILIEPVDEDNAIVIWDKEDHLKHRKNCLNDYIVYGERMGDPLETLKQKIKIVLIKVLKKNEIDKMLYDYLFVKNPQFTRFYLLKIRKRMENVPSTPIIPNNGIAT